jgi:hypothetical protein
MFCWPCIIVYQFSETNVMHFLLNLLRVKEQRNILHEISKRKANWIGHILRRNCLLWLVIEGKLKRGMEVIGRRWRRHRKLLDYLEERRGYPHLKEEALDRTMWRAGFGRGFGPVVRQTTKWMNMYEQHHTTSEEHSGRTVERRISIYTGWPKSLCASDDYNTESYK